MKIEIDDFVLEHCFNHFPGNEDLDEFWWTAVKHPRTGPGSDGEGYLMLWANGAHHHTYYSPYTLISNSQFDLGLQDVPIDDRV